MNTIKEIIRTIAIVAVLVAGVSIVSAWTAPTETPPGGNVAAPVNIGATTQYKSGAFGVGGIFETDGDTHLAILGGNVGIGTASPTQKLDVAGDIKTNSGIWLGGVRKTEWPSGGGGSWPAGSYCVMMNGASCPTGFVYSDLNLLVGLNAHDHCEGQPQFAGTSECKQAWTPGVSRQILKFCCK